ATVSVGGRGRPLDSERTGTEKESRCPRPRATAGPASCSRPFLQEPRGMVGPALPAGLTTSTPWEARAHDRVEAERLPYLG
ncbi:unnamed protein product, partial [Gulo gulo]